MWYSSKKLIKTIPEIYFFLNNKLIMVHSIPRPSCVPATGQTPESSVHTITVQRFRTKGHAPGWAGSEAAFLALKLQQISVSYTMATEHRSKDHHAWSIEAFDHKCFGALPEFCVYNDYSILSQGLQVWASKQLAPGQNQLRSSCKSLLSAYIHSLHRNNKLHPYQWY